MNVTCMLHEYDMHVICMSKMDGLHASIAGNAHTQTCVGHACSSICMYYGNMHATCMYLRTYGLCLHLPTYSTI